MTNKEVIGVDLFSPCLGDSKGRGNIFNFGVNFSRLSRRDRVKITIPENPYDKVLTKRYKDVIDRTGRSYYGIDEQRVYIFDYIGKDFSKIGISNNPSRRLNDITGPFFEGDIEIRADISAINARDLEAELHSYYDPIHTTAPVGEWFDVPDRHMAFLSNCDFIPAGVDWEKVVEFHDI